RAPSIHPVFAGQFAGYWRDGKRVVLDRNAVLPDRCIKCNEPANGYRRTVKLSYVPTSRELMFGAWAYLSAKRAQLDIGLCERHRRSRAVTVALGSLAVILASMIVFTQVRATDITLPLLATAGLIGGVSTRLRGRRRPPRACREDHGHAHLAEGSRRAVPRVIAERAGGR